MLIHKRVDGGVVLQEGNQYTAVWSDTKDLHFGRAVSCMTMHLLEHSSILKKGK